LLAIQNVPYAFGGVPVKADSGRLIRSRKRQDRSRKHRVRHNRISEDSLDQLRTEPSEGIKQLVEALERD